MHGEEKADLYFDLAGGPFHWWKFNLPDISGHIHWRGLRVDLTEVRADFYGGTAAGFARFHFLPENAGANYTFGVMATNVLLHPLLADLVGTTNNLEGRVTGDLVITSANYAQSTNLNGYGNLELHEGLLWDLKLFGVFSPMLEGMVPGLGNSRATAGHCSFNITNAVIYTDNLEIQATPVRLLYRGTVDLDGKVNARVEAELLKNMWVVGPVLTQFLSPLSKIFAYRVTGTLSQPKPEPLFFVPNLVLFPFHPLRSLKDLFPENSYRTNAPSSSIPRRNGS
jgi:hypothetical protein